MFDKKLNNKAPGNAPANAIGNVDKNIFLENEVWSDIITKALATTETYKPKKIISLVSMKKLRTVNDIMRPPKPKTLSSRKAMKKTSAIITVISISMLF